MGKSMNDTTVKSEVPTTDVPVEDLSKKGKK
jgi:hypothetical protein